MRGDFLSLGFVLKILTAFLCCRGPIDEVVLQAVRQNVRGLPVDVAKMNKYVELRGGPKDFLKTAFPPYIPNQILHPQQPNWLLQGAALISSSTSLCFL